MKRVIILLGVPGSGKGTQAKLLCGKFGYGHISTGELLRALETDEAASPEDKEQLSAMRAGELVADDLIYKLAFREIKKYIDRESGVVLDGAIRSVEQAGQYQKFFTEQGWSDTVLAIEIAISDADICTRRESRISSGEVRADDDPEVMKRRIAAQGNAALQPIAAYYDRLGVLARVQGGKSVKDVAEEIDYVVHQKS